jgi:hypothetical protein
MSTPTVVDVLRTNGFSPLASFSGLTKNMRKRRNQKIKRAAAAGGAGGLAALLQSRDFNTYIDPSRLLKKKARINVVGSTRMSRLPGVSDATGPCGGWGRLPNVSPVNYSEDDPRGWTYVDGSRRNRHCRIQDDEEY